MQLTPRYDGPTVLQIQADPAAVLAAATGQRHRMIQMLRSLTAEQWASPSRCAAWTAREVVAHLVSVNGFWAASVRAGLAGEPTRLLTGFDPAATPPLLVGSMASLSDAEVLAQFVAGSDALDALLAPLTADQWAQPAETPAGHVSVAALVGYGLWDSWIHERDIALPLGIGPVLVAEEVAACLRFAAGLSPALALGSGPVAPGVLSIEATDPAVRIDLEVSDHVEVSDGLDGLAAPLLQGDAVELVEALSLRAALPPQAPEAWARHLDGLRAAFDAL